MVVERTLAIIKPDAVRRGLVGRIMAILEEDGFRIAAMEMRRLSKRNAEAFYDVHRGKSFFESLTRYMSSGPVVAILLERENAVERLRELMGNTDPGKAAQGTIRRLFGENIERNAIHGSDSHATAVEEIAFFFP